MSSSPIIATVIFKIVPASNVTRTKTRSSFILLPCCASKRCLFELHGRSHPAHNAARMVHYTEHRPCGCQGMKSYRVPQGGMVSKVSMSKAVLILQVLGPQGSRVPGSMMRFPGFRRSPFMDLGFQGHQRAIRLRV